MNEVYISGELIISFNRNNIEFLNEIIRNNDWELVSIINDIVSYKTTNISVIRNFFNKLTGGKTNE